MRVLGKSLGMLAAVALVGLAASPVQATPMLTVKVQALDATVSATKTVVDFDVYANLTGDNSDPEAIQQLLGNLLASGTVDGDLTFALDSVFMQTPYNHGTRQDLNSDTFKDIGSNATGSETTTTGYHIYANHGSGWYEGNSFKLGSGTFTLAAGSYQVGDTGTVTWAYWNRTVGTAAQKNNQHFQLDDVKYQVTGADSHLKNEPLTITYVPEPATMGLIALGGLALLRRRR